MKTLTNPFELPVSALDGSAIKIRPEKRFHPKTKRLDEGTADPRSGSIDPRPADRLGVVEAGDVDKLDIDAAAWDHREEYPEGDLGREAIAHVRTIKAKLRMVARAFERHANAVVRNQDSLRRALARSYALAEVLRDQPRIVNVLLEERRIKRTKPVRKNLFLALLKLAHPESTPDSLTRWSGALAFAAAKGCTSDSVPEFLRMTGIREAADHWVEDRRSAKPTPGKAPVKANPLDELRAKSLGVALPDTCLGPETAGPFLVIAERTDGRAVAHACLADERLVNTAIRRASKATLPTDRTSPMTRTGN